MRAKRAKSRAKPWIDPVSDASLSRSLIDLGRRSRSSSDRRNRRGLDRTIAPRRMRSPCSPENPGLRGPRISKLSPNSENLRFSPELFPEQKFVPKFWQFLSPRCPNPGNSIPKTSPRDRNSGICTPRANKI